MMEIKTTKELFESCWSHCDDWEEPDKKWIPVDDLISKMVSDGKGNMCMDEAVFAELTEKVNNGN